ncbi:MAG: prepilin-type N-terminal cleavage/methylation domain-containing protein [Sedimentisphaerales bacterium]
MKKKGFTLVELLVVIAIIAMLLAILMPALGKVRQLAQRIMCGTNVGGLGKAMLTYSSDDKYESYPIAGPSGTTLDIGTTGTEPQCSWSWYLKAVPGTSGTTGNQPTGPWTSTLSANLYLLIKYADVSPDQFVCPGSDEKKFQLALYSIGSAGTVGTNFTEVWDFGGRKETIDTTLKPNYRAGRGHNSYSYQMPLPWVAGGSSVVGGSAFPITTTSNPARAVMADRSPYWDSKNTGAKLYDWDPATTACKIIPDSIPAGNNVYHQKDGQNVLYADQHAKFEKSANCGVEQDNIYTTWGKATTDITETGCPKAKIKQVGGLTTLPGQATGKASMANDSQDAEDSFLLSDYN